jgi:hypothetical protein
LFLDKYFDPRAVLYGFNHPRRKRGLVHLPTHRTLLDRGLVFGQLDCHRRQIEHLALLDLTRRYLFQRGLTARALLDPVDLCVLRALDCLQGMPCVARLTTALFAAGLAQTAWNGLFQPITGGGLLLLRLFLACCSSNAVTRAAS